MIELEMLKQRNAILEAENIELKNGTATALNAGLEKDKQIAEIQKQLDMVTNENTIYKTILPQTMGTTIETKQTSSVDELIDGLYGEEE